MRELAREHLSAPGGFFGIQRQPEAEAILGGLAARPDRLPAGGLARHLVDLHRNGPDRFTADHLIGQLWLTIASGETQATVAASLLGMLLEFGELEYARGVLRDPGRLRLLASEGCRRGIAFPASLVTRAGKPFSRDGQTAPAGTACLVSYAAANLDPAAFSDPAVFNPRLVRGARPLAFGLGPHRCSGQVMATQFIEDICTAILPRLPRVQLVTGGFLRETRGISLSVARLLIAPG